MDKFEEYLQNYFKEKGYKEENSTKLDKFKFVIYARKSTKGKEKQEKSIEDQLKYCMEYASSKGFRVVETLTEEGTAQKSGQRDIFREMLNNLYKGTYDAILTWHPDRLARNMRDAGEIIDMLDTGLIKDIKFVSYVFENDSNGKLSLGIQFVLAKSYSDNLSINTKRGNVARIDEGKGLKSDKYGYKLDSNKYFIPDGHNFELIKDMFRMVKEGESLNTVANYLNSEGLRLNGKVNKYTFQFVSRLLKNPFYAGFNITSGKIVNLLEKDFIPAVSKGDFISIRKNLGDKFVFDKGNVKVTLLRGLVNCAFCSHRMSVAVSKGGHGGKYLYLVCTNKDCVRRTVKGHKRQVRSKVVLNYASSLLKGCKFSKNLYDELVKKIEESTFNMIPKLQNKIRINDKDIIRLKSEIAKKERTRDSFTDLDLIKSVNNEIGVMYSEISAKEEDKVKLEDEIIKLKSTSDLQSIKYEKIMNLVENASRIIESNTNQEVVTNVMNLLFMNFTIDDSKVLSYELREPFATYLKLSNSHLG
jgi:DNA invertase Pin-like site-specific DNA recombinase